MTEPTRRARVLAMLADPGLSVDQMCATCATQLPGLDGAAVAVVTKLPARITRCVSDESSAQVEELQFALGEGPSVDAFAKGRLVLISDLTARSAVQRWPAFAPAAVAVGAAAVFAFPLQIGAIRVGVLGLYRGRPGGVSDEELATALVLADTTTLLLLAEDHGDGAAWRAQVAFEQRAVVHQATGMIMVQLGGTIAAAFARLQAYAYAEDRTLRDVADDVVGRRLRFDAAVD
jgi:GAF domain-containing protein